jgi:hypothetical protein
MKRIPGPIQRAAETIKANPAKSDRAIAAELGIGNATVSRARRKSDVSHDTPRTGKDGKSYPATRTPKAKAPADPLDAARRLLAEIEARRNR